MGARDVVALKELMLPGGSEGCDGIKIIDASERVKGCVGLDWVSKLF